MASPRFGELLSQMVYGAMAHGPWKSLTQTADGPGLYDHLAELCHVEVSTVIGWKTKGSIPADPKQVGQLGVFRMDVARMTYKWLEEFLQEGQCFDSTLLERYRAATIPDRPARARHNLPAITRDFIERPAEVSRILEGLEYGYPISIEGFGGMGKSTLAIWVAERCLPIGEPLISQPFEHIVWISAKDFANFDLTLNDVLNTIAERTGFTGLLDLPVEQKRIEVHELLRTQRVLVIADNMETVCDDAVYEFLRRVREPSGVLITTRHKHYRSVWEVTIEGLEEHHALKKIRQEIRSKDLRTLADADDNDLRPLVKMTEGNPKAIELTLGYVKRTGTSLTDVVHTLDEAVDDVEGLFPYLFERDWEALDEPAKRVLLAMPLFAGEARRDALQVVTDIHKHAFKSASEQLIELSLLDVGKPALDGETRYTVHPLTRAFAKSQLKGRIDHETELRDRWITWCVQFAEKNGTSWRTYDLLEEEKASLIECAEWCYRTRRWRPVIDFERSLTEFFNIRGHWEARSRIGDLALQAAKESGDEIAYAWVIVRAIAPSLEHLRRDEQRYLLCREALSIFERHKDNRGIATATFHLGTISTRLRGYSTARPLLDESLKKWEELGDEKGMGEVLNYLGLTCWHEKRFDEARQHLEKAWDYWKQQDRPSWQGNVRGNLGRIEIALGHLHEAEVLLTEALHLFETIGHRYHIATVKYEIGRVKRRQGQVTEARALILEAKDTYLTIGAWKRATEIIAALYCLEEEQDNLSAARPAVEEMIDLYRRLDMPKEREAMEKLLRDGCPEHTSS
jgi:tetratricopeptide (TPR) repeat protein